MEEMQSSLSFFPVIQFKEIGVEFYTNLFKDLKPINVGATGRLGGTDTFRSQKSAKLSRKNDIELVGYTFRLKNCFKDAPFQLSDFQS